MSNARISTLVAIAVTLGAAAVACPSSARAHFVLEEPAAATSQDGFGNPQKQPPCGGGADTGVLTAYAEGSTITITVDETITHPGHYRVSLGTNGPGDLPPEPPVTEGSTPCGSTIIQDPPVFPVLADGELLHTSSLGGPKSFQVTLPAGVTCDHCTLQVLEFMSDHQLNDPGGCFYHHCANISVGVMPPTSVTTAGATSSGSGSGSGGGGGAGSAGTSSGCSCATAGDAAAAPPGLGALAAGLAAMATVLRRRSARSGTGADPRGTR